MAKRYTGRGAFVTAWLLAAGLGSSASSSAQELGERARQQILAVLTEKASRTPAQRKLETSLLYAGRESRGLVMVQGLPTQRRTAARAHVGRDGMVTVRIRAEVTDELRRTIAAVGGRVLAAFPDSGAVKARIPISRLETIAELPEVRHIGTPLGFLVNVVTSLGDKAHAADVARPLYHLDGAGVRIGVLSNGVDSLVARQTATELPPDCTASTAPGDPCVKVAVPQCATCTGDEGTAMMEIIHDLAPKAQLYFAGFNLDPTDPTNTADVLMDEFAANILTLRNTYGCDIIVDDVTFFEEGAFQDDVIAQAVSTVTASGALYFSSAGNSGRKSVAGWSGTWEGDYKNSNTSLSPTTCPYPLPNNCWDIWAGKEIHTWNGLTGGSAANSNPLTSEAPFKITLQWSDPLGGATTDYDLFILDLTLSEVLEISADDQTVPGQNPFEWLSFGLASERIVVVRWSGATKALRLDTFQGGLTYSTEGAVFGHNGGENTISVAAAGVASAGGGAFVGGTTNPVENYSSDGPRRMFFYPNGTPITPGNVLFATGGGRLLKKPDITAADCVETAFPSPSDFNPFCGTSAAAPHAAAIAALLLSGPNNPSVGQVLAALLTTPLDVTTGTGGTGWDRDSGLGIVMADRAGAAMYTIPAGTFYTVEPCRVFDTRVVGPQTTAAPLACGATYDFKMVDDGTGAAPCGVPTDAKAVSLNVTVTAPTAQGYVMLFPSGVPKPLTSVQNYVAGLTRANNATAPLGAAGLLSVRCNPGGAAHVIVDVNGYYK